MPESHGEQAARARGKGREGRGPVGAQLLGCGSPLAPAQSPLDTRSNNEVAKWKRARGISQEVLGFGAECPAKHQVASCVGYSVAA